MTTDLTQYADLFKIGIETADDLYEHGGTVGVESAMSTLIDVTMRYYYNIKNALTKGDFRRNELRFFAERNIATVNQFLKNRTARMSIEVDTPEYMVGTYKSALTALLSILHNRDMKAVMNRMAEFMRGVTVDTAPTPEFIQRMRAYTQEQLIPFTRDVLVHKLSNEFSGSAAVTSLGSKGKRRAANEVIGTHDDFVSIYNELLKIDDIYRDVIDIQKTSMPLVDRATRDMISRVHSAGSNSLDEATKKDIYVCLRRYAEMVDGYGVLLQLLQTLEHNFVLSTSALVEANR